MQIARGVKIKMSLIGDETIAIVRLRSEFGYSLFLFGNYRGTKQTTTTTAGTGAARKN